VTAAAGVLDLLDWKRRVFASYADVRASDDAEAAWRRWRERRDELFRTHPQSPSRGHEALLYFPYDPTWRIVAKVRDVAGSQAPVAIGANDGETVLFLPFALAEFSVADRPLSLELYWLEAYGGGVFLPFRDATNGKETYGGGRYLLDTVKGADLGGDAESFLLDFNFAYNPSCSYAPHWVCPLAPPANTLDVAVRAGEQHRVAPAGAA
jgi:uncharacterized protein